MDDDTDRSSEATQLEEISTAEETMHHDGEDSEDDATPLQVSPMSPEEDSTTSQPLTLAVSDFSEVPVKYEMQRDELERLKNQLQGSHQEALATVIAQAARVHSKNQISSLECSNSQGQNLLTEVDRKDTIDTKSLSASASASHHVNYNWRKYGQKQVKSPQGSRSYYKCTNSDCDAKKIESCDELSSVTNTVYKGQHKHDPPKKVFSNGGNKILSSPKSIKRKSVSTSGLKGHFGPVQDDPQQKQRVKKSNTVSPDYQKKPKFIVHAADDVEISADGYRWRKYGQKMVKGNPHPRNYYKCTCAGCPVRKHIEKAVDGTSNVIITYKEVHDHDKPVPKKPHALIRTTDGSSVSAIESTPTLLSIGFEIKNC